MTKLSKRAATALELSIEKWRQIECGEMPDIGADNCALCLEFNRALSCAGCPVSTKTGLDNCRNTPYEAWAMQFHLLGGLHERVADSPQLVQFARAERKFLESLRDNKS